AACLAWLLFCCHTAMAGVRSPTTSAGAVRQKKNSPPPGFVEMSALGVMSNRDGNAVILRQADGKRLLPIWIGATEAYVIQLRLNRQRFQRPLTHDLLDEVIKRMGGRVVEVRVDDLKQNTFLGKVYIKTRNELLVFDARPSDSIALAVGNGVPIYVSLHVLDQAGIDAEPHHEGKQQPEKSPLEEVLQPAPDEQTL
ncbi:MAG: bifunctional nuclease family protein, partial [Deltaproteobacteria bacterium]